MTGYCDWRNNGCSWPSTNMGEYAYCANCSSDYGYTWDTHECIPLDGGNCNYVIYNKTHYECETPGD